jgi:predicted metal-binding protein
MEDKLKEQFELFNEMVQKSNINVVTCGNCGAIVLHKVVPLSSNENADIECHDCGFISDPCNFPDLYME